MLKHKPKIGQRVGTSYGNGVVIGFDGPYGSSTLVTLDKAISRPGCKGYPANTFCFNFKKIHPEAK